jgi:hypothetical protein
MKSHDITLSYKVHHHYDETGTYKGQNEKGTLYLTTKFINKLHKLFEGNPIQEVYLHIIETFDKEMFVVSSYKYLGSSEGQLLKKDRGNYRLNNADLIKGLVYTHVKRYSNTIIKAKVYVTLRDSTITLFLHPVFVVDFATTEECS